MNILEAKIPNEYNIQKYLEILSKNNTNLLKTLLLSLFIVLIIGIALGFMLGKKVTPSKVIHLLVNYQIENYIL